MKYLKQIGIIFGVSMAGELLNGLLPLPVPAGVYGLFLLLAGLCSGVIRLSDVEATGNLLLDMMTMMFIPATVGIMESWGQLKEVLLPYGIIIAVSTVLVMIVTGRTTQTVMKLQERRKNR